MRWRRSYSIRERLLYSFFLTAGLMCLMVLYSFLSFNSLASTMTSAYRTNASLSEFQTALRMVESSMENYVSVRSFGSLEAYYGWRGKLDEFAQSFNVTLSDDPVLLLEFKVKNLMTSFLEYADKTVYARRGNKFREYTANYSASLRVYGYLAESLNDLNAQYFRRNAASYNNLFSDMKLVELLSILTLALFISINFLIVYILINRITGPLVELSKAANELAAGNFDVALLGARPNDEVGNICRAFDRMTVSIRENIETIRTKATIESRLREEESEMRALYKEAQLRSLQAQINPHFLFNTLNAGAQLAMMEGADATCAFIEKTADFFRYNIQKIDKETRLSEEIALVDNYMYIMKVRFADRLSYIKDIRCPELDVSMPSMVLQPLVENSIKHGVSAMPSGGTISLRVFRDGGILCVEVSDNGPGIGPEVRERLLRGENEGPEPASGDARNPSVGIGMRNVITRLRVFFGDGDIFDIRDNAPEPGTTFSIRIRDVPNSAGR